MLGKAECLITSTTINVAIKTTYLIILPTLVVGHRQQAHSVRQFNSWWAFSFQSAKSISATNCPVVFKPYKHHIHRVRFSP